MSAMHMLSADMAAIAFSRTYLNLMSNFYNLCGFASNAIIAWHTAGGRTLGVTIMGVNPTQHNSVHIMFISLHVCQYVYMFRSECLNGY